MGLGNVLFGRKKLKEASTEKLFALSTARVTLEAELGLKPSGSAALCFKPLSAGEFVRAENEMQELLEVAARSSESRIRRKSDEYGFEWIVVEDPDLEDLVTTVHLVTSELQARGFGPQLLASIFRFEGAGHPVYWIYGYKRGAFWPFVPTGKDQERDNAEELELKAKLERELPIEDDLSRWFGMFDAPL
ncbi:MAG: PspA-associated protein PspAB [Gaiellaceae bacterium]